MTLEQLTYFLEVAGTEHVGKAAKALAISPSAISHSIRKLEEELGRDLFLKQGKRIHLTEHGKLLRERAQEFLQEAQAIQEEMQSDQVELRGHYRLAGTHVLCARFLAPAWAKVQSTSTNLTGELYTLRSSQVVAGVVSGEYDLGLCFSPQAHPDLDSRAIKSGRLVIAVRPGHPLKGKKPADWLKKISGYTAVLPKAFQGIEVCERHPVFDQYKIETRVDSLIDSYEVGLAKVASSDSWTFIPDFIAKGFNHDLSILSLPPEWDAPYSVSMVWKKNRYLTAPMRRVIETLEQTLP